GLLHSVSCSLLNHNPPARPDGRRDADAHRTHPTEHTVVTYVAPSSAWKNRRQRLAARLRQQGTERPLTVDVNRLYVADPDGPSRFL
ncbi:MAG TPA: hypothetical protein VG673_18820, partial [Actinomycetota bacterium]|nr:hypothetical protein [Actinomycetota bacterium]